MARMSHSYCNNYVHLVFSTKGRRDLIPQELDGRLYSYVAAIAQEVKVPFLAAGGMPNHAHVLIVLPSTMSVAEAVRTFKANSSRFLCKQGIDFEWQKGYGAFGVSASKLDAVSAYVLGQREHHKKMTFEQEFVAMLKKAGVAYDPKVVFG